MDAYFNFTTTDNLNPGLDHILAVWNKYLNFIQTSLNNLGFADKPFII